MLATLIPCAGYATRLQTILFGSIREPEKIPAAQVLSRMFLQRTPRKSGPSAQVSRTNYPEQESFDTKLSR
ncbi:MAG: hypothetical protein C4297_02645 [Gemmataceae bacterium]